MFSLRMFTTFSTFSQAGEIKKYCVTAIFVLSKLLQVSFKQGIIYI